jgi:Zn-dependent peptidase ImmA (M78 family)/DNA-binding XRE family transcriptional regulator
MAELTEDLAGIRVFPVRMGGKGTTSSALGARLREARKHLRLSQSAVADFMETTRQTVAAYERGLRQPGLPHLIGMANVYRQTLDELMKSATSAIRAAQVPRFHARYNDEKTLTEHDRQELASFTDYLQQRPRTLEFTFQREAFETVAQTVKRWREKMQVENDVPVPVFNLLARCGIEARFTALEKLAGALVVGDAEHPHGVLVNTDQPRDRQRYSAAHEAGHLVLGHQAETGRFISYLGRRFNPVEVHADQFAAELLVPIGLLQKEIAKLPDEEIPEKIYRLKTAFLVSYQAMATRLVKLGAVSPSAAVQATTERPSAIAKRLRLSSRHRQIQFQEVWLPELVKRNLPKDWHQRASAETVRLLQETAYHDYVQRVPDHQQADDAATVYRAVALWVARKYPLVAA